MLDTLGERPLRQTIPQYGPQEICAIRSFLDRQGTFEFPRLETGLFSAARLSEGAEYTGYQNAWVRDNVHIAYAHYVTGQTDIACRCVEVLCTYFQKHQHRFVSIIQGEADASDPMKRPHIRFNGQTLEENPEQWSHAQNDALGYFLWLYCKLALAGFLYPRTEDWDLLGLFPLYFREIRYWQDEDSGHWEEARKVEASSIGTVVAGLREMRTLLSARIQPSLSCAGQTVTLGLLDDLIEQGHTVLESILPSECVSANPAKTRRYDAALLFLISPLNVVAGEMADRIVRDVEMHLLGDCGVRRYLGDSFWCANYKTLQSQELRTADVSSDMAARDSLLQPGQEAQWCIFDPLLSTIYGQRYAATGNTAYRERQMLFLNRSLSQLTKPGSGFPPNLCPELYYLESDQYVPNDVTPLLWTQANLIVALEQMQRMAQSDPGMFQGEQSAENQKERDNR